MNILYLLRHAPTCWNQKGKIQGHADLPLASSSVEALSAFQLSPQWHQMSWVTSPLVRARQTACCLGISHCDVVPQLIEMDWGEFEGLTLKEINRHIEDRKISPSKGRYFRPPKGESPAEVAERLMDWLSGRNEKNTVAVTHKGVIRAALSVATGWDMMAPFAKSVDWSLPQKFHCLPDGKLELVQLNTPW